MKNIGTREAICSLLNSKRWKELNRFAFLTAKYPNLENSIFQHVFVGEKIKNPYKKKFDGMKNIRMRNGIIRDTLSSVDIVENVECGGNV